jgi:hypothetical protein
MDRIGIIILVIAASLVFANAWVTYVIYKSDKYERVQKAFQVILIWIIPIFGVSFVYLFFRFEGQPGRGQYAVDLNLTGDPVIGNDLGDGDFSLGSHHDI